MLRSAQRSAGRGALRAVYALLLKRFESLRARGERRRLSLRFILSLRMQHRVHSSFPLSLQQLEGRGASPDIPSGLLVPARSISPCAP